MAKRLLWCGAVAGPLYIAAGLAQMSTRDGFDMRRHPISLLSNGDLGWIQIANFVASGALVLAGAAGVRRTLRGQRAGTWAPLLLAVYGLGLVGAGIFRADPGNGFPPGVAAPPHLTQSGLLHFVFGGLGFYGLIAASFVFARRFAALGRRGWSAYSAFTGAMFFASFAAIASGSTSSAVMLTFYAAVAWIWIWHATVYANLLSQ